MGIKSLIIVKICNHENTFSGELMEFASFRYFLKRLRNYSFLDIVLILFSLCLGAYIQIYLFYYAKVSHFLFESNLEFLLVSHVDKAILF